MSKEATMLMACVGAFLSLLVALGVHFDDAALEAAKTFVGTLIPVVLAFYARSRTTSEKTLAEKYTADREVLQEINRDRGATLAAKIAAKG